MPNDGQPMEGKAGGTPGLAYKESMAEKFDQKRFSPSLPEALQDIPRDRVQDWVVNSSQIGEQVE